MIKIPLSHLRIDQLYTLGSRIKILFDNLNAEALGILLYVTLFLEKFADYSKSYENLDASAEAIGMKDSLRGTFYRAFRVHVKNFKNHDKEEKRAISRKLLKLLNKDGSRIYDESYSIESASMKTIIKEIDKNHLEDLELLFASEWYQLMKAAQIDFEVTFRLVNEQVSDDKLIVSASEARNDLEDAMRDLFAFLPLHYKMTKSPELAKLIRNIQTEGDKI